MVLIRRRRAVSGLSWQLNDGGKTRLDAAQDQPAAMQVRYRPDEAQPKSETRLIAARVQACELLLYPVKIIVRNARPIIVHADTSPGSLGNQRKADNRPRRRMVLRIFDKVDNRLADQLAITVDS